MYISKGLRHTNVQKVRDYFIEHRYATRQEIANAVNLSPATITNTIKELLDSGFIQRVEDCESTGGRKSKRYRICGKFMLFCLMDLHVEHGEIEVCVRIIDLDKTILENRIYRKKELFVKNIAEILDELRTSYDFQYVGISVPGVVRNGIVWKCDIDGLENVQVQRELEQLCRIKAMVENDVNTAMLGYIHLHRVESPSIAFIYQPDNHFTGCGLYINHKILYGATNFAGELAYLPYATLDEQEEKLKTDAVSLLITQVVTVNAVVDPSLMVLYTPCVGEDVFEEQIVKAIPSEHLPQFQFINGMDSYVFEGLSCLCIENSRYKGNETRKTT